MGMGGSTSAYDCTFTAEIKSQTDARMEFSIPAVMGGMTLTFQTGDAPADLLLAGTVKKGGVLRVTVREGKVSVESGDESEMKNAE